MLIHWKTLVSWPSTQISNMGENQLTHSPKIIVRGARYDLFFFYFLKPGFTGYRGYYLINYRFKQSLLGFLIIYLKVIIVMRFSFYFAFLWIINQSYAQLQSYVILIRDSSYMYYIFIYTRQLWFNDGTKLCRIKEAIKIYAQLLYGCIILKSYWFIPWRK